MNAKLNEKRLEFNMDIPGGGTTDTEAGSIAVSKHYTLKQFTIMIGINRRYANGTRMILASIPSWMPKWFQESQFNYWHLKEFKRW